MAFHIWTIASKQRLKGMLIAVYYLISVDRKIKYLFWGVEFHGRRTCWSDYERNTNHLKYTKYYKLLKILLRVNNFEQ